ncbi:MAG TPA: glycosyltransferase [Blastocatellia bacterium]|nr:glycosyltransferase [Blastocatellia bacterium]
MPTNSTSNQQPEPVVSVIVPCYNSEQTIRQCLNAIINQRTTIRFDVTVVDSSTDSTPRIVKEEFPTVRLIHLERRTFAGPARNVGIRATRAPYCLMIDSDCIARPDLIERMIARHREDEYAAVGGSLRSGTRGSLSGLVGYLAEFKEFMPTTPMRIEKGIPTANIAYRRDALERSGGFDPEMELAEDILLNWKIHSAGERILFDPAIEVTHLNRTGWRNVLSYQVRLGRLSAKARRRGGLPGKFLLDFPAMILLMPFVRTINAAKWLARYDKKMFRTFLLIWPMYLLAMAFWSFGFFQEAEERFSSNKPDQ